MDTTTILQRLDKLEAAFALLKQSKTAAADAALEFERLPQGATVGKDYIAYRFGCSERSVVRRESGTDLIKLKSRKPIKAIKRDVDAAWHEYKKPIAEKAAAARAQTKPRTVTRIK